MTQVFDEPYKNTQSQTNFTKILKQQKGLSYNMSALTEANLNKTVQEGPEWTVIRLHD